MARGGLAYALDAALEVVFGFQDRGLGGDQAEHDHLAGGHEARRLEGAGSFVVVLEEVAVGLQAGEHRLGDEVVAARAEPRGAVVAAAHVHGHGQAVRAAGLGPG
jgi:hypothetical protein